MRSAVSVSRRSGRTSVAAIIAAANSARPSARAAQTSSRPLSWWRSARFSVPKMSDRIGRSSSWPTGRPRTTTGAVAVQRWDETPAPVAVSGRPARSVTVISKPAVWERSTSSASDPRDQPPW